MFFLSSLYNLLFCKISLPCPSIFTSLLPQCAFKKLKPTKTSLIESNQSLRETKTKMFASTFVHNFSSVASCFPNCHRNRTLVPTHHHFHSPNSLLKLKTQPLHSNTHFKSSRNHKPRPSFVVFAAQSNFFKVLQNAYKVGRDGIEAGTNLVPSSVPRPIAKISVTILGLSVTLFVLKAFLSTAFFILATIGLAYFAYLAFNKDQGPSGNGGTTSSSTPMDDPVEEARKIMEKYK